MISIFLNAYKFEEGSLIHGDTVSSKSFVSTKGNQPVQTYTDIIFLL